MDDNKQISNSSSNDIWRTPDESIHKFVMEKLSRFKKSVLKKYIPSAVISTIVTIAVYVLYFMKVPDVASLLGVLLLMGIVIFVEIEAVADSHDVSKIFDGSVAVFQVLVYFSTTLWCIATIVLFWSNVVWLLIVSYVLLMVFLYLANSKFFRLFKTIASKSYAACPGVITDVDENVIIRRTKHSRQGGFRYPFLMVAKTHSLNGPIDRNPKPVSPDLDVGKIDGVLSNMILVDKFRYDIYYKGDAGYILKIDDEKLNNMITFL